MQLAQRCQCSRLWSLGKRSGVSWSSNDTCYFWILKQNIYGHLVFQNKKSMHRPELQLNRPVTKDSTQKHCTAAAYALQSASVLKSFQGSKFLHVPARCLQILSLSLCLMLHFVARLTRFTRYSHDSHGIHMVHTVLILSVSKCVQAPNSSSPSGNSMTRPGRWSATSFSLSP